MARSAARSAASTTPSGSAASRTPSGSAAGRFVQTRLRSGGKVLGDEEKAAENVYIKKMEQEKPAKVARKGPSTGKQAPSTPSSAASDVNAQRRRTGTTGKSPTSRVRGEWDDAETKLLYEYCADIKLTEACYEIVTQRLCDSGFVRSISSVRSKIRNTKKVYEFWKNVMMDPAIVKDEPFWQKQDRQFHALKNGPPKHLNLMERIFEPLANWKDVQKPADSKHSQLSELHGEAAAEFSFLVDDLKKLCLATDKVEKAAQLVNSEQGKIDNIDIENVDQLISAYNLALAAVKEKPTDDRLMRVVAEARSKLTAAIFQPD